MTWVINCVLVFSVIGLGIAAATGNLIMTIKERVSSSGMIERLSMAQFGVNLAALALAANILIIVLSKLGVK